MKLTRKAREQARHDRATVRQQVAACVDQTDPRVIARQRAQADEIRRKARARADD